VNEIKNKMAHFRKALASKWVARIATLSLVSLALLFSHPNSVYRSYFRQLLSYFVVWSNSAAWDLIRNATYLLFLVSGLFLIAIFLNKAIHGDWRKEILAINCAWTAFVLQASLVFGLQWEAFDVWITQPNVVEFFFWGAIILSAASILLLTPFKWASWFGYFVTWGTLIANGVALCLILRYWILYSNPFPALTALVVITNLVAIYSFHSKRLSSLRLISYFRQTEGFGGRLQRIFTSPKVFSVILALVLLPSSIAFFQPYSLWAKSGGKTDGFYIGVSFCGHTVEEAKCLVDRVKNFTNVFVVQSLPISYDEATLNEICDYAVASGLSIIVYFSLFDEYWQINWLNSAEARWGGKFLGVYLYDEPGGLQLDQAGQIGRPPSEFAYYSEAANWFVNGFWNYRTRSDLRMLKMRSIKAYVSDYALYWFDYKAGYDTVFVQLGWNHSRQLHVALCRGAANTYQKNWGAIVTWRYNNYPYCESGEELYSDMVLAYDNGANYVLIFDYPYASNSTYGILEEEHFDAMNKFWSYTKQNPQSDGLDERVAYVLPRDYGYGFRGPIDNIWGRFEADNLTMQMCADINELLLQFGTQLDIVYDDEVLFGSSPADRYREIVMWSS
jgi:hypothetical protein